MQRISTLQALLLGAVPTLLFAIIALAVWEPRGATELAGDAAGPRTGLVPGSGTEGGDDLDATDPEAGDDLPADEDSEGGAGPVDPTRTANADEDEDEDEDESLGVIPIDELERVSGIAGGAADGPNGAGSGAAGAGAAGAVVVVDDLDLVAADAAAPDASADAGIPLEGDGGVGMAAQELVGPPCGPVTCESGWECCNASCGICTLPGQGCSQRSCGMPYSPSSVTCGPVTCDVGELCCNPACGECILPGEPCDPRSCLSPVTIPYSETCGMTTCNTGMVCCNPSCGICTPPGQPCSREVCE